MGYQNWAAPAVLPTAAAARYELRPLSLGELLDRTFSVYRSRFTLFAGITVISASVQLAGNALAMVVAHSVLRSHGRTTATLARTGGQYLAALLAFLVVALIQAATVWALSEVYLGRATTVGESLRAVRSRWLRYIGVVLWQLGAASWPMLVLFIPGFILMSRGKGNVGLMIAGGLLLFLGGVGGAVYAVFAYLRNALGVQSAVIEQLTVRQSMRRSKTLTRGAKGKIFVVLLVAGALLYVAAGLEIPFVLLWVRSPNQEHILGQAVILLINFVTNTLVTPVAMIGLSLVYFDQRIRMEGFDLMVMLGATPAAAAPSPAEPTTEPALTPVAYPGPSLDPTDTAGHDGPV